MPGILADNRRAIFIYIKKFMTKSRQWVVLESSVEVLRLRKCNKIRNHLRKNVDAPSKCEIRSAITKFLSISSQKQ